MKKITRQDLIRICRREAANVAERAFYEGERVGVKYALTTMKGKK